MKKSAKTLLFLCLFFPALFAQQTGSLVGRVVDEDNLCLPGANIILPDLNLGAASDRNGEFRVANVPAGRFLVKVLFIGFQEWADSVTVAPGQFTRLDVTLKSGIVELGEVQVVGERLKGKAKALNQQKTNFVVSNVVSADQIGRFPDQNIGDALKRIPAISVNYNQGEARYLNIRGAGPRLNSVLVDGEPAPSADGETRAVQMDLIPTDMIQSLEVRKTLTPDMEADAIGGSVNLLTRQSPFGRRVATTLGSGYNVLSGLPMLNGSLLLGQRFFAEKLGLMLNGSWYDHHLASHNAEGLWALNKDDEIYVREWEIRQYDIRRLRQGVSLAADYRANEQHRYFLNIRYHHRDDWENRVRLRYRLEDPNKDGLSKDTEIQRQTKGGPDNRRNNNARLEDQRTNDVQLKGKHNFANLMQVEWTISHGRAWERRPHERYISWVVPDTLVAVDAGNPRTPYFSDSLAYSDFLPDEISEEYRGTEERDTRFKIDIDIPLNKKGKYESVFYLGGKLKYKTKWRHQDFVRYRLTEAGDGQLSDMTKSVTHDYSVENFLAGDYRLGRYTTYAWLGGLDFADTALFNPKRDLDEFIAGVYDAKEDVSAAYVMLDQELGKKLRMKIGLRMEHTNVRNNGFAWFEDGKKVESTEAADDYTNWLPGLHFKYEAIKNLTLRFAWSNTLARPNFYDLVPYREVSGGGEVLRIGNPVLRPTTSGNLDFSVEKYDENIGILSAGLFAKNIDNFIYIHKQRDYEDEPSGHTYDEFYQPRNGATASLWGLELSLQRQLGFLPGWLANLGLYGNYTYIHSAANSPNFPQKNLRLPGAAPHTLNLSLTYETPRLNAGLSFNYTSPYLDPDELDLTPGLERYYDRVTYLDFSGSCAITSQLYFYLEGNNLLNQPLRYYAGEPGRTYQQEYYSMRFTAGLKYDL